MMEVSLYIEVSSRRIKPGKACYCYVLEYISPRGNVYTQIEIGCMETTGIRLVLTAAVRALKKLKPGCRVTIHTDLKHLKSALELGWLQNWKTNGWLRNDGKEVKNRDLWEEIEKKSRVHDLQVEYMCKSSYTTWMQNEMKKADLKPGEYKEIKGQ